MKEEHVCTTYPDVRKVSSIWGKINSAVVLERLQSFYTAGDVLHGELMGMRGNGADSTLEAMINFIFQLSLQCKERTHLWNIFPNCFYFEKNNMA